MAPRLFVVSGPSGAGKGTLVSRVREARPDLGLSVSATTRDPRPGEEDGVAYHFLTDEAFDQAIQEGRFLEWAHVAGHRSGTLLSEVDKNLSQGHSLILEIDVQGALQVKEIYPDAVLVFIEPHSKEELERRLRGRGTEAEKDVQLRLGIAAQEMELASSYDARVINDDLEVATHELLDVLSSFESE